MSSYVIHSDWYSAMTLPELRGRHHWVFWGERQESFVAGDQVIGLCRLQGTQDRLVHRIGQRGLRASGRLHEFGLKSQAIDQVGDFSVVQAVAVRQPRQDASQLFQNEVAEHHLQRPAAPGCDNPTGHAGRIRQPRQQDVGVQNHAHG